MKKALITAVCIILCSRWCHSQVVNLKAESRALELVKRMTLEEKLSYISGYKDFYIRAIPRLGIPEIRMADGPQGVRNNTKSTLYPAGILSASTWNRDLIYDMGRALGMDARARGVNILLGPGVNIYRAPMCGRNFEYFGEDPYLASETAKEYIQGVQSEHVISTIKHFACNNEEWDRNHISSDVDARTLHEIYLPVFEKAVKEAKVGAVMNSYNLINGVHNTENGTLNIDILRKEWGFKGILMSDWTSVYSGIGAANGGLDLEMPNGKYMNAAGLLPAIKNGVVLEKTIDEKVVHILSTLIGFGFLDQKNLAKDTSIPEDNPFCGEIAYQVAREGIVLLKNNNQTLPIKKGKILVLGPNANNMPRGGGSGYVNTIRFVSIYDGLKKELGEKNVILLDENKFFYPENESFYTDEVSALKGFKVEYFNNKDLSGTSKSLLETEINHNWGDGSPLSGYSKDGFSSRWTSVYKPQKTGLIKFEIAGDDGFKLFINDSLVVDDWSNHALKKRICYYPVQSGNAYKIRVEYFENVGKAEIRFKADFYDNSKIDQYLSKYKIDKIILCVGFNSNSEGEGSDRSFALPSEQENLINEVEKRGKKLIVILNAGGGIKFEPWIENTNAVLMAWYPGQEGGRALAEIVCGKISPSGKLPISIEKKWEDNPVYESYYDTDLDKRIAYKEGVFVGYRGYDQSNKEPLFPFGYGLSYTQFSYRDLRIDRCPNDTVCVSFKVKNIGKYDGSEISEVYVHECEPIVPRPIKELKGYDKVFLRKGEEKEITIKLDKRAFAYYQTEEKKFIVNPGKYEIYAGGSSKELPLKGEVDL